MLAATSLFFFPPLQLVYGIRMFEQADRTGLLVLLRTGVSIGASPYFMLLGSVHSM